MKPVFQTIFEDNRGNCFAACVASILELPIEEVPNFVELSEAPVDSAAEWLKDRKLEFMCLYFNSVEDLSGTFFEEERYCILSGPSPRKNADGSVRWHSVVAKSGGWGLRLAHDPHPDQSYLVEEEGRWVRFIVPEHQRV